MSTVTVSVSETYLYEVPLEAVGAFKEEMLREGPSDPDAKPNHWIPTSFHRSVFVLDDEDDEL